MNQTNKLNRLPDADQLLILQLCEQHTYEDVVNILAKPRDQGGLNITSNPATLCRFYTRHGQQPRNALVSAQFAHAMQVRRESAPGAYLTAILAMVEINLLEALRAGKPATELAEHFRFLKQSHSAWFNDVKARDYMKKAARVGYDKYLRDQLESTPEADYLPNDLENDPGAPDTKPIHFITDSTEEIDRQLMSIRQDEEEFHSRQNLDRRRAYFEMKQRQAAALSLAQPTPPPQPATQACSATTLPAQPQPASPETSATPSASAHVLQTIPPSKTNALYASNPALSSAISPFSLFPIQASAPLFSQSSQVNPRQNAA